MPMPVRFLRACAWAALAVATVVTPGVAADGWTITTPWPDITYERPLWVQSDGSSRLYVIEQAGRITWFDRDKPHPQPHIFLDLSDQVNHEGNEEGMLAMAFHPKYATNHYVYIYYCLNPPRRTRLARFTVGADGAIDPATEVVLVEIMKPWANHNGGTLLFDRAGCLLFSCGDGGGGGDPHKNGQNTDVLLGKIMRIDVDHEENGNHYAIPPDNPFAGQAGKRGEIWAYGLRNVWRMSFDRDTGDLWAGDVGQDLYEEVDVITKGGNYGWNAMEGTHPFKNGVATPDMIPPIIDYPHSIGRSVTGGYVYRGKKIPALFGKYIYADYATSLIWALTRKPDGTLATNEVIGHHNSITSFGEDDQSELYFTSFDHHLHRFEPGP